MLCDGSPRIYETRILGVLEKFQHDSNERLRKASRKVLATHRRTGTLNIL